MQAKLATQAEGFIDADHRQQAETSLFRVVTDAPQKGAPESVAGNLEAVFWVLNEMLKGSVPAQPAHGQVLVYMFAHEAPFRSFADSTRAYEWAAGFYSPTGVIAFHMEAPSNEHLREVMLHEAVHAFIDRFVVRPGARVPVWLDEGLADYIGNSEVRKRKLVPGKHRRSQIYHAPGMATIGRSISQMGAMDVKKAMKKGEALPLAELVAAERDEFYGDQRRMFYTESWMLVHFLRHGRDGWADDEFPRFVLYVAEGYPAADAFVTVYGAAPAEMEEEFRRYVMSF
jgi:hypothetical protein